MKPATLSRGAVLLMWRQPAPPHGVACGPRPRAGSPRGGCAHKRSLHRSKFRAMRMDWTAMRARELAPCHDAHPWRPNRTRPCAYSPQRRRTGNQLDACARSVQNHTQLCSLRACAPATPRKSSARKPGQAAAPSCERRRSSPAWRPRPARRALTRPFGGRAHELMGEPPSGCSVWPV